MKTSVKKHNRWLYIFLVLMIVTLMGFSLLPIFNNSLANGKNSDTGGDAANQELLSEARGYELVLQREPDNETALRGLLETKLRLVDVEGAIAPLEKLAQLHPEQVDYRILAAQAKQQINDNEGAAQTYREILASTPGEMKALQGLINLYLSQQKPEAAIGILEDTLKIALTVNTTEKQVIDVSSVELLLGEVYVSEERYKEAIALYDRTIKTNPQDFRPVLAKALTLQKTADQEASQQYFQLALKLAPTQYKDDIKKISNN